MRFPFLLLFLLLSTFVVFSQNGLGQQKNEQQPNILIIMADDLGYSDLGCYGGEIETPNLDALAQAGLRFRNFYNTARCCPTRAALLTGQYQHKVGLAKNGRSLNRNGITIAEVLKTSNYQTGMVGKWHLTQARPLPDPKEHLKWLNHQSYQSRDFGELATYPTQRGFDKFYGIIWGVVDYFDPFSLVDGEKPVKEHSADYYITDDLTRKSVQYINSFAKKEEPFFLYVAYTAPHWPIHALPEDIKKYENTYQDGWEFLQQKRYQRQIELGLVNPQTHPLNPLEGRKWETLSKEEKEFNTRKMAVHAAMVDRVDQSVGEIVEALKKNRQLEHTLILFLADNGASPEIPTAPGYDRNSETRQGNKVNFQDNIPLEELGSQTSYTGIGPEWANAINTPYRFWKYQSYGGGIRTPAIVYWNGLTAQKGQFTDELSHVMDILPTVLEITNTAYPSNYDGYKIGKLDGISLLPVLKNTKRNGYQSLYFEHEAGKAAIQGDWKITLRPEENKWRLYNLEEDATESTDLANLYPNHLETLKSDWQNWYDEVTKETEVAKRRRNAKMNKATPGGYLFAHMTKENYGGLYYSVSEDGLNWNMLNGGQPVDQNYRGHPDIVLGHDDKYYMIGIEKKTNEIILWTSRNFLRWRETKRLPKEIFDGTQTPGYRGNPSWYGAPKVFYDDATLQYMITWHAPDQAISRSNAANYWCSMRTFYVLTSNFETFTLPKKLFPYDMGTIDVIIRKENDLYYAFLKNECEASAQWPTGKTIRVAVADQLEGPYAYPGPSISPNYHEAPTLIPKKEGKGYLLYYEMYTGKRYTASEAPTLAGPWWNVYQMKYDVPENARHGCMWPLTKKQYDDLLGKFNKN